MWWAAIVWNVSHEMGFPSKQKVGATSVFLPYAIPFDGEEIYTEQHRLKVNNRKENWCCQKNSSWQVLLWFSTFRDWHVEAVTPTWGKAWAWTRSMGVAVHQGNLHSNFLSWGPVVRGSHLGTGRHQGIRHPALPLGSWKVSGPAWSSVSWLGFLPPCRPPRLLSGRWWQPRWQSWCTGWCCWASSHLWCWPWGSHAGMGWVTGWVSMMFDGRRCLRSCVFASPWRPSRPHCKKES